MEPLAPFKPLPVIDPWVVIFACSGREDDLIIDEVLSIPEPFQGVSFFGPKHAESRDLPRTSIKRSGLSLAVTETITTTVVDMGHRVVLQELHEALLEKKHESLPVGVH